MRSLGSTERASVLSYSKNPVGFPIVFFPPYALVLA
jgi:hypothetical protein